MNEQKEYKIIKQININAINTERNLIYNKIWSKVNSYKYKI